MKEAFVTKAADVYLKKKLTSDAHRASLNKLLLFVIAEVDRIYEEGCFDSYPLVKILMGKLVKRRISKDAIRRIFLFVKQKPEPTDYKDAYKGLLAFLDKASKGVQEREEEGSEDEAGGE